MEDQGRVTISVEVLNELLGVLGNMPYIQSVVIIEKIKGDIRPLVEETPGDMDVPSAK